MKKTPRLCTNLLASALLGLVVSLSSGAAVARDASTGDKMNSYIRLGMGVSDSRAATFADQDCAASNPAALFGCGNGPDGNPIGAYGDFGTSVLVQAAWGYYLADWFRGELAFDYRPGVDFAGQSNFTGVTLGTEPVAAKGRNIAIMANGYVQLDALFGEGDARVHPFLSGGVGVAFNRTGAITYSFPSLGTGDTTITPAGTSTDFAWSLGAGLGIDLTDRLGMELAYRYVDLGTVETAPGDIIITREGRDVLNIPIDSTKAALKAHEVLFSLVYRY
jgi:opacity protein-like surface antigen